jgi:chemotaxis protein CheC
LNARNDHLLDAKQAAALASAFHQGAAEASHALARWIGRPSLVQIDSLEELPLEEATSLLAAGDDPICFCATQMRGLLTGEMIFAFDDASGFALADMVLDRPQGTTRQWTELATSAALETTNILCCAYLNSLSRSFDRLGEPPGLLPSPPMFSRDFAESLLQSALMGQAIASDRIILGRTRFEIAAAPEDWTLLFVPDARSKSCLAELLPLAAAEP